MQHLVQMKMIPQPRPANDEEGLNWQKISSSDLKQSQQLQQNGKILAGGPISGTIGFYS